MLPAIWARQMLFVVFPTSEDAKLKIICDNIEGFRPVKT
jgi:hypothetical protein